MVGLDWQKLKVVLCRHVYFLGPGLVSAVAYIDPGNWATDLEAGSNYGYKLLFIVLLSGCAAVVLQLLSVRLGIVTSTSLPHQTRQLFLRLEAKYPKYRIPLHCCLWALYLLAEVAIIGTDLAELLGTAIALNLLFPRLPLFAAVLITAVDVLLVLLFFRSNKGRQGMLLFEVVIVLLVLAVFVSFIVLLHLVKPEWREVFLGLLPSKTLVQPGALYVGVGIIGATVMPHALFLGSSLASVDRLNMLPRPPTLPTKRSYRLPSLNILSQLGLRRRHPASRPSEEAGVEMQPYPRVASTSSFQGSASLPVEEPSEMPKPTVRAEQEMDGVKEEYEREMKRYEREVQEFDRIKWAEIHILHATIDTSVSLLGFAVTINASILTLGGAAYFYNRNGNPGDADLQGAHKLLIDYLGNGAGIIFALALLCAGQSASITATLAGQVVSEGFINWRTSPLIRRFITRLIGVIPAAIIAAAAGNRGLNTMLVASQVLLSIVLPTVIFPLVYLCSDKAVMRIDGPQTEVEGTVVVAAAAASIQQPGAVEGDGDGETRSPNSRPRRFKLFDSPKWVTVLGYLLFTLVLAANMYVIIELARGRG